MDQDTSLIIPTFNEKEGIATIIDTALEEINNLNEIIIVDDNSPDLTWQKVEEIARVNPKVRLIRRLRQRGLPQAIAEGIRASRSNIVLWIDADFSSVPLTLKRWVEALDDYDIVVASRYIQGGRDRRREKGRIITSKIFNQLARFLLKTQTKDLTSGYILAKKDVFDKVRIGGCYGDYCVRFLFEAERSNFRVKEFPYICFSRRSGRSKASGSIFQFIRYGLIYLFVLAGLRLRDGAKRD